MQLDPEDTARMRFVTVAESMQRRGIGKMMVEEFERETVKRGLKRIYMHAREDAFGFYSKQGYERFGEKFDEAGIVHFHV